MNKTEFIKAIAAKSDCSIKVAGDFYEAFVATVEETLKKGEKLHLLALAHLKLKSVLLAKL